LLSPAEGVPHYILGLIINPFSISAREGSNLLMANILYIIFCFSFPFLRTCAIRIDLYGLGRITSLSQGL
jgi:hypothetical protein